MYLPISLLTSFSLLPSLSPSLPFSFPPSCSEISVSQCQYPMRKKRITSFEADLAAMKSCYYREKLNFLHVDSSVLAELAKCYLVGVQWVLSYYYHGVPSWSW